MVTNGGVDPADGEGPTPFRPISVGPPGPGGGARFEDSVSEQPKRTRKPRSGRALDRFLGILIGLILGIGVITAFVFLGSENQIDAPRITTTGNQGVTPPASKPAP